MKKNIKKIQILVSLFICINSFGANDINAQWNNDKTYRWGFGASLDILYGGQLFNQFNYYIASNYNDMGFNANNHVSLLYQTSTSIFAEYINIAIGMLWLHILNLNTEVWIMYIQKL